MEKLSNPSTTYREVGGFVGKQLVVVTTTMKLH